MKQAISVVGIDLSINSTFITSLTIDGWKKYSVVPNYKKGRSAWKVHEDLKNNRIIEIKSYEKLDRSKDYREDQQRKITSAHNLASTIVSLDIGQNPIIFLEGFSYMSKGSSTIDLIMYNSFVRKALYEKYGNALTIVSPTELKKYFYGKGNANKVDMLEKFISIQDPYAKFITKVLIPWTDIDSLNQGNRKIKIQKPIDDMIDSYALVMMALSERYEEYDFLEFLIKEYEISIKALQRHTHLKKCNLPGK